MKWLGWWCLVALGVAACSSPKGVVRAASTSTTASPVGSGYLASFATAADFVQWTIQGGYFTGTMQSVEISGTPPNETTSPQSTPVSGHISGSTIALQIGSSPQVFGTYSGDGFTINLNTANGLVPSTFHRAGVKAYNDAVASLQQTAGSANQAELESERQAQLQRTIDADVTKLNNDLNTLANVSALSTLNAMADDLTRAKGNLDKVAANKAATIAAAQNGGDACFDAGNASFDASNVSFDMGGFGDDLGTVASAVSGLRSGANTVQADFSQLGTDEAQLPSYSPAGAPSSDAVNAATTLAGQKATNDVAKANDLVDTANSYLTQALALAGDAVNAANVNYPCAQLPPTSPPLAHIS
jgi:hypothetical protein